MLRLITGRARSGKSRRIRELLAEKVRTGGRVLLIVPEQYSFESEKNLLNLLGATNQDNLEILYTFTSLARELLAKYRGDRRPALTGAAKDAVMSLAIRELAPRLSIFNECCDNPSEVHELTSVIEDLSQNGISFDDLTAAAADSGDERLLAKAKELSLISDTFRAVACESRTDTRFDLEECARIISENRLFTDTSVFIDEFYGFTHPELEVIGSLLRNAVEVVITAVCENIFSGLPTDALAFGQNTARELLSLAERTGAGAAVPELLTLKDRYASPAVGAIEKNIFSSEDYEPYTGPDSGSVTVVSARTPYEECDFIASEAKRLVRENGLRYRDIAVIERGSVYSAYLPFAFAKYDIPVFRDRRKPLTSNPIIRFAQQSVDLAANGISTDGIFNLLKTGLTNTPPDDIYALENYAYVWKINSISWTKPFTRNPSGFGKKLSADDEALLNKLEDLRGRTVGGIMTLRAGLRDSDGTGLCRAVYEYLIRNEADKALLEFARTAPEEDAIAAKRSWDILMDLLTELAEIIGQRNLDAKSFSSVFDIMCMASDTGEMPSGLDEITVGSADRVRLSDKKVVFIAGANEGVFPAGEQDSFVLTTGERRVLIRSGAQFKKYGQANSQRERFLFYAAISRPSERLCVCYSRRNYSSGEMLPSDPVLSVRTIVPEHTPVDTAYTDPVRWIESRRTALLAAVRNSRMDTVFSRTLTDYALSGPDSGLFSYISSCGSKPDTTFKDTALSRRLFENIRTLTPSQIEKYYNCAFSYFCRYGIRAFPIEPASYDASVNGSVIHAALESVFTKYGSEGLLELSDPELTDVAEQAVEGYALENIGGNNLDARTKYSLSRAANTVTRMLRSISAELRESKYQTTGVEVRIGFGGDVPAYPVRLPDGTEISVGGIADRVDVYSNGSSEYLRVLDYKTGNKDIRLDDVFSGINLQMPVYLFGLCRETRKFGKPLPAGIFYVPGTVTKPTLDRHASESRISDALEEQNRLKGLVVLYPDLPLPGEDGKTEVMPKTSVKTPSYRAVCVTEKQYARLQSIVNGQIADMAESLYNGRISAEPLLEGNRHDPCKHCDYKSVCRREAGDGSRSVFSGDTFEELNKGEDPDG